MSVKANKNLPFLEPGKGRSISLFYFDPYFFHSRIR
jgi:hypothetical protein